MESTSKINKNLGELIGILHTMDIPIKRQYDFYWLIRNLGVRNRSHPKYKKAMALIVEQIKNQKK